MTRVAELVSSAPAFAITSLNEVAAGSVVAVDGVWHRQRCVCPEVQERNADSRRRPRRKTSDAAGEEVSWTFREWGQQLDGAVVAACCVTLSDRASDVLAALVELDCTQRFLETSRYVAAVSFDDKSPHEKVEWLRHVLDLSQVVVSATETACLRAARHFDAGAVLEMYVAAELRSAAIAVAVEASEVVEAASSRCEDSVLVPELCELLVLSASPGEAVSDMVLDRTPTLFAAEASRLAGNNGVLVRAGSVAERGDMIVSVLPFYAAMTVMPAVTSAGWKHVALVPDVPPSVLADAAGLFEPASRGPMSSLATAVTAAQAAAATSSYVSLSHRAHLH